MANPTRMGGAADAFQQGFRQAGNTVNTAMNMMQRQRELNEMARQADMLHLREVGKTNLNLLKEFAKNSPAGALGFVKDNPAFLSGLLQTVNPAMNQQQHGQAIQQIMNSMLDPQSMMKEMASLYFALGGTDKYELDELPPSDQLGQPPDFAPTIRKEITETKRIPGEEAVTKVEGWRDTDNPYWKWYQKGYANAMREGMSPEEWANRVAEYGLALPPLSEEERLPKEGYGKLLDDYKNELARQKAAHTAKDDDTQFVPAMPSVPIETIEVIPTFEEVTTTNILNKPVGRVEDGKWKLSDKETIRGTDVDKILDALHAGSKYEGTVDEFKQEIYETYKSLYPGKYADANDFLKKNLQKIAKGDGLMMPLVPQNYEELNQLVDDSEKQVGTKSEQWWQKYGQDIAVAFDERDPAGFEKKLKAASPNLGRYAQQIRDLGPVRWMKYANGVVQRMGGIEALRRTASPLELEMVKLLAQVTIQDREFALKGEQWLAEEGLLEKKGQLIDAQIGLAQAEARKALMGGGNNEMMKYVIQRMKMEGTGPYAFGRALKDPMVRGALTAAAEQFAASLAATGINFEWVEKKFRAGPGWAGVGPLFGWGAPHEKLRVPEVVGELTLQQQQEAINRALQNLTPAQREKYGAMIGQMMQ